MNIVNAGECCGGGAVGRDWGSREVSKTKHIESRWLVGAGAIIVRVHHHQEEFSAGWITLYRAACWLAIHGRVTIMEYSRRNLFVFCCIISCLTMVSVNGYKNVKLYTIFMWIVCGRSTNNRTK